MRKAALTNLRVVPGRYTFSSLVAWQQTLIDDPTSRALWWGIDADEHANRVRVNVASAAAAEQIGTAGGRLGIPLEALLIRVEAPPSNHSNNLRERYRPAFGGLQIVNEDRPTVCTLGWNVTNASTLEEGFLTAGHCVNNSVYGTLGTRFANAYLNSNSTLGTVQLNPLWNDAVLGYGGVDDCQGYYPCTHADVVWVRHNSSGNSRHTVARTEYAGVGDGNGSISIVGTFYPGAAAYVVATGGPRANKVGRLTGWTSGYITQTCLFYHADVTIPCTHRADMRDGEGDSGSPVFYDNGNGSITPLGVLWGGPSMADSSYNWGIDEGSKFCQLNCYILFSDFQRIAMHLGTGFYPEYY